MDGVLTAFMPPSGSSACGIGMGASWPTVAGAGSSSTGMLSLGVAGCESMGKLLRSRGRAMLVRRLSVPAERSTSREEGAGLWRLRRCSGRVKSGYSSRVGGRASPSWGCCTGTLGSASVRGDELTGFHRRDAGGRGGAVVYSERKLRLKRRLVRLQRAGSGGSGADGLGDDGGGPTAAVDAVVRAIVSVGVVVWTLAGVEADGLLRGRVREAEPMLQVEVWAPTPAYVSTSGAGSLGQPPTERAAARLRDLGEAAIGQLMGWGGGIGELVDWWIGELVNW